MFIVYYTKGTYEDYMKVNVFVTTDKSKASKWVSKFNKMSDKWSEYYVKNRSKLICTMIEDLIYFEEVGKAYFEPIEVR